MADIKIGSMIAHAYYTDNFSKLVIADKQNKVVRIEKYNNDLIGETLLYHTDGGIIYSEMTCVSCESEAYINRNKN